METPTDQPTDRQGEYSAICLFEGWEIEGRDLQLLARHCPHHSQTTNEYVRTSED